MDVDALYEQPSTKKRAKKKKSKKRKPGANDHKAFRRGKLSGKEKDYILVHWQYMTDEEIGEELGRSGESIRKFRQSRSLSKIDGDKVNKAVTGKRKYLKTLDQYEKRAYHLDQLKKSITYKELSRTLDDNELRFYEQKYIDFMSDPTVETVTHMERDMWHEMTISQIREMMYIRKEREPTITYDHNGMEVRTYPDYSSKIQNCQENIRRCQEALNVTRRQRLKDSNDQAINFTEVVKELRSPATRRQVGDQAAMFRYICERHYNDHVGDDPLEDPPILSGDASKYDVDQHFKTGKEPEGLNGDFTGDAELAAERKAVIKATTGSEEAGSAE